MIIVAVADRAEYPGAVNLIAVGLRVKHAVNHGVEFVNLGILRVEVEDGVAHFSYAGNGVHALPDKVARVEVRADFGANRLAQFHKALGVVNAETRVKFERDFVNAVRLREGDKIFPVGDEFFIPLPLENLGEIIGPGADNPVGVL
jgi:hypothetical protein